MSEQEKCGQKKCEQLATAKMCWPGRDPIPVCASCLETAKGISNAMGFYLPVIGGPDAE
jgi:hypothetical protein